MTITEIENLNFEDAKKMAIEIINIKGHQCIFADLGKYFGYSVLVFRNSKHIYHVNDYQLHHSEKTINELKNYYIKSLNKRLFTDAELLEPIKTYEDYEIKSYFVRNYWIMQFDYLSMFRIGEKTEKEFDAKISQYPYLNKYSFCYVKDENIIKQQAKFMGNLKNGYKKLKNSLDTFTEMVKTELENHEACITCDYTDALNALRLNFEELTEQQQRIVIEELNKQIKKYY